VIGRCLPRVPRKSLAPTRPRLPTAAAAREPTSNRAQLVLDRLARSSAARETCSLSRWPAARCDIPTASISVGPPRLGALDPEVSGWPGDQLTRRRGYDRREFHARPRPGRRAALRRDIALEARYPARARPAASCDHLGDGFSSQPTSSTNTLATARNAVKTLDPRPGRSVRRAEPRSCLPNWPRSCPGMTGASARRLADCRYGRPGYEVRFDVPPSRLRRLGLAAAAGLPPAHDVVRPRFERGPRFVNIRVLGVGGSRCSGVGRAGDGDPSRAHTLDPRSSSSRPRQRLRSTIAPCSARATLIEAPRSRAVQHDDRRPPGLVAEIARFWNIVIACTRVRSSADLATPS